MNIEEIKEVFAEIHTLHNNLKESLANGYGQLDEIHRIKKDFGDFWIPKNILKRQREVDEIKEIVRIDNRQDV